MRNKICRYSDKLKDIHLKELLAGSSISFISKSAGILLWYVFIILITKNLGAEAMGVFAISYTVLEIVVVIGRLGFDTALTKLTSEYLTRERWDLLRDVYFKTLKVSILFGLFLSIVLYFASTYISQYIFQKGHLTPYFRLISYAILPLIIIYINLGCLRGMKKMKEFSFIRDVAIFLFSILVLIIALNFEKSNSVPIFSYTIAVIFVSVISLYLWLRHMKFTGESSSEPIKVIKILNISFPMLLSSSLVLLMGWMDTLMLGVLKTEAEVGIYSVVLKVAMITGATLYAVNSIAAPKFAELYAQNDISGLAKIVRQSTKLIFWTSFPMLLIFFIFPFNVLGIFGEEIRIGGYALMVLALGQFVSAICGSVGYLLQMTGRERVFQNIILIATAINIVLNALLIPEFGINGAAFASLTSLVFWNIASVKYIKKNINISTWYVPFSKA